MTSTANKTTERRKHRRVTPHQTIRVMRVVPVLPISDAQVLNTSPGGVAIRTAAPVRLGERLSFFIDPNMPPLLAEALAIDSLGDGTFRVRCKCLVGGFDA